MSWLSALKEEAQAVRAQSGAAEGLVAGNAAAVQPQMQALKGYLEDLAEQLNLVNPQVHRSYDVLGYTALPELKQTKYVADAEVEGEVIRKLEFGYQCVGREPVHFWVDTREECTRAKDRLLGYNLSFRWKDDAQWRYICTLQSLVHVSFEFEPHSGDPGLSLKVKNLDQLGEITYIFEASRINEKLMDELGKRIVREDNTFDDLSGYRLSDDIRKGFQEKIAARRERRDAELSGTPAASPEPAKKPGRFTKLFRKESDAGSDKAGEAAALESPARRETAHAASPAASRAASPGGYTWLVTGSCQGDDTSDFVGRIGPQGSAQAGVHKIIEGGAHFRMCGSDGTVRYTGYIVGEWNGLEPLEEYGKDRGCSRIEYERGGSWRNL